MVVQGSPILYWQRVLSPESRGRGIELGRPALRALLPAPAGWLEVRFGNLALRAPLDAPYREVVALLAPDPDELSFWRSPWANWEIVGLLRSNISGPLAKVATRRFVAPGAKGVVSDTSRPDLARYLVSAHSPTEHNARELGLSGISWNALLQILGSIEFDE